MPYFCNIRFNELVSHNYVTTFIKEKGSRLPRCDIVKEREFLMIRLPYEINFKYPSLFITSYEASGYAVAKATGAEGFLSPHLNSNADKPL